MRGLCARHDAPAGFFVGLLAIGHKGRELGEIVRRHARGYELRLEIAPGEARPCRHCIQSRSVSCVEHVDRAANQGERNAPFASADQLHRSGFLASWFPGL